MARMRRKVDRFRTMDTERLEERIAFPSSPLLVPVQRRGWLGTLFLAGVVATVCTGVVLAGRYAGAQRNDDLAGISDELVASIAAADFDVALSFFAESPRGNRIMGPERRRVFGVTAGTTATDPEALAIRQHTLEMLRAELSAAGVQWSAVDAVAFAGVRTRFLQSSLMKAPASMVWGHVYFRDAGRLYALEVTAWECGDQYVLADIWHWAPVSVAPAQVESFAKDRARERIRSADETPDDFKIMRPRRIYLTL